jgi:hypothetical protein
MLQLGGTVDDREGEEAQDVVVVFGEVIVQGTVRGDVVVVFGRVTVEGEVRGSWWRRSAKSRWNPVHVSVGIWWRCWGSWLWLRWRRSGDNEWIFR